MVLKPLLPQRPIPGQPVQPPLNATSVDTSQNAIVKPYIFTTPQTNVAGTSTKWTIPDPPKGRWNYGFIWVLAFDPQINQYDAFGDAVITDNLNNFLGMSAYPAALRMWQQPGQKIIITVNNGLLPVNCPLVVASFQGIQTTDPKAVTP